MMGYKKSVIGLGLFLISLLGLRGIETVAASASCKDLLDGNFPVPSDGRAITPCQTAYGSCMYVAALEITLKKLKDPDDPEANKKEIEELKGALDQAVKTRNEDLVQCGLMTDFFASNPEASSEIEAYIREE